MMSNKALFFFIIASVAGLSVTQENDSCRTPPAGWPRRPPQCCDLPFPLDSMKKQFGDCIRQIGRPSSAVPTARAVRDARLCIEECVYKGMGFFEGSGLEKKTIADQLTKGVAKQPVWVGPMDEAIKTCFTDTDKAPSAEAACNHTPHVFTHCVMRKLFLHCPASQWNNSDECNLVKSRMEICPNIPPPPPRPTSPST